MKISFSQHQLFDMVGFPLVSGRVSFYLHGSDTLANIYTLDGDNFVEATNPVILDDAGSFPQTVFMEASIYDVKIEKLTGNVYSTIDTYQFGFIVPDVSNDTVLQGIDGLMHANPELGFVTVVGYDNVTYAGPRVYMWDAQCTEAEDGGCIIGSESVEDGRWLLLSDLREMPSTYYGVEAGREANIAAFISYQPIVGTHGIFMPPVPRFLKGTYTTEGTLSTSKVLSFDQGAKFTKAVFVCSGVEIANSPNYVADFLFTAQQLSESRWFRTAKRFWQCGARELHQSRNNFFEDASLGNYGTVAATLLNQKITGTPLSMTGAGRIEFNHCNIGNYALSTNWYTVFKNCDFTDKWFNDANWDFGATPAHRQVVKNTENNVSIDNFSDANVFVLQQAANSVTALDLQNRMAGTISADMAFTLIRNAVIDTAHFNHNVALENCNINHLYLEQNLLALTTRNCSAVLEQAQVGAWADSRSIFALGCDIDTTYATLNWIDTSIDMASHKIGRATDDLALQNQPVFLRCTISNGVIASSCPALLGCNLANTHVYVYPGAFMEGNQVSWTMSMEFRNNRFNGSSVIAIGGHNGITDHLQEVYECKVASLAITDNVFNTTSAGIACPFWAGPGLSFRFIRGLTTFDGGSATDHNADYFQVAYEYRNNHGNCPRTYAGPTNSNLPGALVIASHWASSGIGSGMSFESGQTAYSVFTMPARPNANKDPLPDPTIQSGIYQVSNLAVTTPYRAKAVFSGGEQGGNCADFPTSAYLPVCAYDKSLPNDMFNCIIGAWGQSAQFLGVNPIAPAE